MGVPFMGNYLPKGDGTMEVRNLVMLLKTDSRDPLIAGRKTGILNGDFPAGFNYGTIMHELGSWSLADTNHPVFTPSGPYWEGSWQGTSQTNGSVKYQSFCCGHGGSLEGLVYTETEVRGATTNLLGGEVPIQYRGTYGPENSLGLLLGDDFNAGRKPQMNFVCHALAPSQATFTTQDGQAVIDAQFRERSGYNNTGAWGQYAADLSLPEGQVGVLRVDLAYAAGNNVMFQLGCLNSAGSGAYLAFAGRGYVGFTKTADGGHCFMFLERPKIPWTNVVLSLAIHHQGNNVFLTTQIQDKGPGQAVLYQKTVVDTPVSDPGLIGKVELEAGVYMTSLADISGNPWTSLKDPCFGLWQNTEGNQPVALAVFDNFSVARHDLPSLNAQRAILITWPATAFPFQLEAGAWREGTGSQWRAVTGPVMESNGLKRVVIPVNSYEEMELYRLK